MSVEEAVRSMTSAAAERLGLRDRGLLRDGFVADVVVFDPERVRSNATYDEPRQFPDGIEWVLVGGDVVVGNGGSAHRRTVWTRPATTPIIAPRAAPIVPMPCTTREEECRIMPAAPSHAMLGVERTHR